VLYVRINPLGVFARMSERKYFTTGQKILESGIYTVHHSEHRLPHEVTLLQGEQFPRCGKCADRVGFELLCAAPEQDDSVFQIRLYELPEIAEAESAQEETFPEREVG
jgi:hypothetical protein